jgi:hypothetical protein
MGIVLRFLGAEVVAPRSAMARRRGLAIGRHGNWSGTGMGSDDSYPKKHIVLYPTWHDRSHYDQTTRRILSGWLLAKAHSSCGRVRLLAGHEIETEPEDSVDGEQ